jgi:NAD(P)-dependent dehydrogenase (short-subunit alcohol dehydrogenase family)
MTRLAGKRAIVIGSAHGMGRATAEMFAREGATVIVADILVDVAEAVAEGIRAQGGDAWAIHVDIADEASVAALIDDAAARLGGLDVLHNNAAVLGDPAVMPDALHGILDIPIDVWDRTMAVNLRGVWLACKHALPLMRAGGGGSIINTASLAALSLMTTSGAYSVSKGAVNTLTMAIATHYGRFGVRCNAINPGMIRTRHLTLDYERMLVPHNLIPRIGEPDDIASLVTYLASDESGYVTGQLITIDGGFSVHVPTYVDLLARADLVADQDPAHPSSP